MKNTYKRYFVSSLITFATGFILALSSVFNTITPENIGWSVVSGVFLAGLRGGIKALAEWVVKNIKI